MDGAGTFCIEFVEAQTIENYQRRVLSAFSPFYALCKKGSPSVLGRVSEEAENLVYPWKHR